MADIGLGEVGGKGDGTEAGATGEEVGVGRSEREDLVVVVEDGGNGEGFRDKVVESRC